MSNYKLCIVGTGAAGLLTLFSLSFTKIPPEEIVLIDPYHDGGDLQRKWSSVVSNTIWKQMLDILRAKGLATEVQAAEWNDLDPAKPALLARYIQLLRHTTKSYAQRCETLYGFVTKIQEEEGQIRVSYGKGDSFKAKVCIVATGCDPKTLGYPIPTIPLEIALNPERLKHYVQPNQTVSVFGLAHSGTLILRNLHSLRANTHAFYKGETPFLFARDGEYDGIKQESEAIADSIMAGSFSQTALHPFTNTAELIRWTRRSDWVIYATGFQRTALTSEFTYNGATGQVEGLPNTWGFGIAFPNQAADGVHWDVSLPSFFSHIEAQIPKIVESFYA